MNAVSIALGLLLFAQPTLAQERPIALSWSAPEGAECPDQAYATQSLSRMLGPPHPGQGEVLANVTVRRLGPSDWQLRLDTEQAGVRGQRVLRDASCQALADAAVVILAWMIDPEKMAAAAAAPAPPPPKAPKPPPDARAVAPKRAPLPLEAQLAAELALDVGTLPRAAAGVAGRVELEAYPVRWGVHGGYFPSVTHALEPALPAGQGELGGRFRFWDLGVQLCLQHRGWVGAGVEVGACAGPELDVMRGVAFGVTSPASGSKAWLSGVLELSGRYELAPHWSIGLRAAGVLPSVRENFSVHNLGVVHQPAAVALRIFAGLELVL